MAQGQIFREILELTDRYGRYPRYYPRESNLVQRLKDIRQGLLTLAAMALTWGLLLYLAIFPGLLVLLFTGVLPTAEVLLGIAAVTFVLVVAYFLGSAERVRKVDDEAYAVIIEAIANAAKRGLAEDAAVLPQADDVPQPAPRHRFRREWRTK